MPKQILPLKINMQNLVILAIFLIGSLILYRMIIGVRSQFISLKNDFEALRMMTQSKQNNAVVNVFEKSSPINNDDNMSINSEEIDSILRKLNSEPVDTLDHSTEGRINEAQDHDEEIQSEFKINDNGDNEDDNVNVELDKVIEDYNDENHLENYTEDSLKKKQLGELKSILKKQNKQIKGNKVDLIKNILE